jgi:hypothetical protein
MSTSRSRSIIRARFVGMDMSLYEHDTDQWRIQKEINRFYKKV